MTETYRALAIDDEEIVLLSVEKTLGPEGYKVDKALSAKTALEKLETELYDVIVTDLMMPEINGIEFLEILKQKGICIPTVMVTGYPTIKTAIEALKLGAVDYVPKPFTRQELISPVSRAVQREEQAAKEDSPLPLRPSLDGSYLDVDTNEEKLTPGDVFVLRKHSWAKYEREDIMRIGVEESFLLTVGVEEIIGMSVPQVNEIIEQGHASITVKTRSEQEHRVYMPLSGRVVATNSTAIEEIRRGNLSVWVLEIKSSKIAEQVGSLKKRFGS